MNNHDTGTDFLPVYHTPTPSTPPRHRAPDLGEPSGDWVGFGRAVLAAHQPQGDTCAGCGRIWMCCPIVVVARQHGLNHELVSATPRAYQ